MAITQEVLKSAERPLPPESLLTEERVSWVFAQADSGRLPKRTVAEMLQEVWGEKIPKKTVDRLVNGVCNFYQWIKPECGNTGHREMQLDRDEFLIMDDVCRIYVELGTNCQDGKTSSQNGETPDRDGRIASQGDKIPWGAIKPILIKDFVGTRVFGKFILNSKELRDVQEILGEESAEPNYRISETELFNKFPFGSTYIISRCKDMGRRDLSDAEGEILGLIKEGKIRDDTKLYPGIFRGIFPLEIEADIVFLIGVALKRKPVSYNDCTVSDFRRAVICSKNNMENRAKKIKESFGRQRNEIFFSEVIIAAEDQL
jgi:hypothetical protein